MDYLIYKDLGYCIKVVSSGDLFQIKVEENTITSKEQQIRKSFIKSNQKRRMTLNLAPTYEKKGLGDGIGWVQ